MEKNNCTKALIKVGNTETGEIYDKEFLLKGVYPPNKVLNAIKYDDTEIPIQLIKLEGIISPSKALVKIANIESQEIYTKEIEVVGDFSTKAIINNYSSSNEKIITVEKIESPDFDNLSFKERYGRDIVDLQMKQALPLEAKINMTISRIWEWYRAWNGQIYVSFSGGKDSTVLLHIVRSQIPDCEAVFVDTGLEYPETREFVKTFDNVTWLKPKMNFRKVIDTYGYPLIGKEVAKKIWEARNNPDGVSADHFNPASAERWGRYSLARWENLKDSNIPISDICCVIMKKAPIKEFEKETGKHPMMAIMACESRLRKQQWLQYGCNAFDKKRPVSNPLSFWYEEDILQYIKQNNVPLNPAYGKIIVGDDGKLRTTGCNRTGCVFCGFGCHLEKEPNRFQRLEVTHPKLWEYCMRDWDKGGLGMAKVLESINVKWKNEKGENKNE